MRHSRLALLFAFVLSLAAAGPRALTAQDKPDDKDQKPAPRQDTPEAQFQKQIVDFLKSELDLSDEQTERVGAVMRNAMNDAVKIMLEGMGDNPDFEQMRKDQEAIQAKIENGIRDVLDEGQKKEFEVLIKDFEKRQGRFERAQRDEPGGDAALWLEGDHPTRDSILAHASNALILNQEEQKAIFPLIEKVVDLRLALREHRRSQRKALMQALHGGAKNDEVQERLHVFRRKEAALREDIEKASGELRELLTIDQEVRLVALGILD